MKHLFKSVSLVVLLSIMLSSCEFFELFQEEEIRLYVDTFGFGDFEVSAQNIAKRKIEKITWEATVYDEENGTIDYFEGKRDFLEEDKRFNVREQVCICDQPHHVRVTIWWKSKNGRSCFVSDREDF